MSLGRDSKRLKARLRFPTDDGALIVDSQFTATKLCPSGILDLSTPFQLSLLSYLHRIVRWQRIAQPIHPQTQVSSATSCQFTRARCTASAMDTLHLPQPQNQRGTLTPYGKCVSQRLRDKPLGFWLISPRRVSISSASWVTTLDVISQNRLATFLPRDLMLKVLVEDQSRAPCCEITVCG